jgi:predicted DNA-binding transcriptional regulator YafY
MAQALALALMQRECAASIPPAAREALQPWFDAANQCLREASHTAAGKWADKVAVGNLGPPLLPAKVSQAVMDGVSEALFLERQIQAEYKPKHKDKFGKVHLHPLGLIRTGLITYLVAVYDGYDDPRLLPVHRLRRVQILSGDVITPAGFKLKNYLQSGTLNFGNGNIIKLKCRMLADLAEHLSETPLSGDQVIATDGEGYVTITATVADSPRLEWWLRGFGAGVEVISPRGYLAQGANGAEG